MIRDDSEVLGLSHRRWSCPVPNGEDDKSKFGEGRIRHSVLDL